MTEVDGDLLEKVVEYYAVEVNCRECIAKEHCSHEDGERLCFDMVMEKLKDGE